MNPKLRNQIIYIYIYINIVPMRALNFSKTRIYYNLFFVCWIYKFESLDN